MTAASRHDTVSEATQVSTVEIVEVPQSRSVVLMSSMVPDPTDWLAADDDVEIVSVTCNDDIARFIPGACTMLQMAPEGKGG